MLFLKPPPLLGRVAVGARGRRCAALTDRKLTVNELVRVIEERVSSRDRFLNRFPRSHSCYISLQKIYSIIFSRSDYEFNKTAKVSNMGSNMYLPNQNMFGISFKYVASKICLAPAPKRHIKIS